METNTDARLSSISDIHTNIFMNELERNSTREIRFSRRGFSPGLFYDFFRGPTPLRTSRDDLTRAKRTLTRVDATERQSLPAGTSDPARSRVHVAQCAWPTARKA